MLGSDPHPGNLLATTAGDLVYLDFGASKQADAYLRMLLSSSLLVTTCLHGEQSAVHQCGGPRTCQAFVGQVCALHSAMLLEPEPGEVRVEVSQQTYSGLSYVDRHDERGAAGCSLRHHPARGAPGQPGLRGAVQNSRAISYARTDQKHGFRMFTRCRAKTLSHRRKKKVLHSLPSCHRFSPPMCRLQGANGPSSVQAMCRDYYTLDFVDASVDTAPIAPELARFFNDVLDSSVSRLNFKAIVDGLGGVLFQYPFRCGRAQERACLRVTFSLA